MNFIYAATVLFFAASMVWSTQLPAQQYPQLERGKEIYAKYCALCHGADGKRGEGFQTPIWGEGSFIAAKFGNAKSLIEYMQIMPFNDPGLINDVQRLDVTAFVLANHGALSSGAELSPANAATVTIK